LVVVPCLGITHGDLGTDITIMGRVRYSVIDDLSVGHRAGAGLGDLNEFLIGVEGKYQILHDDASVPLDLSIFTAADFGLGDATLISWGVGPLVGKKFDTGQVGITPYGGVMLGVAHGAKSGSFGTAKATEVLFGFIVGTDLAFSDTLSAFTEFTIGVSGGVFLVWQLGLPINVLGG
jgi:hypothetical protein